jgi:5-hydroxyisourate hydrolase-like protein (transthyretin family)
MKRNYTHRNSGKFCIQIRYHILERDSDTSQELLEVKNLATGRVVPGMIKEQKHEDGLYNFLFKLDHLDAGEYEITERFNRRFLREIDLCQSKSEFSLFLLSIIYSIQFFC